MPCCQYCGRRFVSEGLPGCPYCRKPPAPNGPHPFVKAHLYKVGGVRLAALWNTRNA